MIGKPHIICLVILAICTANFVMPYYRDRADGTMINFFHFVRREFLKQGHIAVGGVVLVCVFFPVVLVAQILYVHELSLLLRLLLLFQLGLYALASAFTIILMLITCANVHPFARGQSWSERGHALFTMWFLVWSAAAWLAGAYGALA